MHTYILAPPDCKDAEDHGDRGAAAEQLPRDGKASRAGAARDALPRAVGEGGDAAGLWSLELWRSLQSWLQVVGKYGSYSFT